MYVRVWLMCGVCTYVRTCVRMCTAHACSYTYVCVLDCVCVHVWCGQTLLYTYIFAAVPLQYSSEYVQYLG